MCRWHAVGARGITVAQAYASEDAARGFIRDMKTVRGGTLRAIAAGFKERKDLRLKAAPDPVDFLGNPLVALQSAPGGGKSAMLDTVGLMSARSLWTAEHRGDVEMRGMLSNIIPVTVTYNSGTEPALNDYDPAGGANVWGQLGSSAPPDQMIGDDEAPGSQPTVFTQVRVVDVHVGAAHNIIKRADGAVLAFGRNQEHQLLTGDEYVLPGIGVFFWPPSHVCAH